MNKTMPKFIMLCGLPASGKTTYAEELQSRIKNSVVFSSDAIRKELYGDENIQGDANEVFNLMNNRVVQSLNNGYTVIYDATNITRKSRAAIISMCPKFVKIECHIIWTPIQHCIMRDKDRKRTVGEKVIDRMVRRFQAPFYDEGFDEIEIIRPDGVNLAIYTSKVIDDLKIPHDNSHHTLDINLHCHEAHNYINNKLGLPKGEYELPFAALIHDIGKPYTKDFHDAQGNPTPEAHFYQHQCVGAWMSYGFTITTPYVAWLISTHMDMFLHTKYYKNLPNYLKEELDLLHEADLNAH